MGKLYIIDKKCFEEVESTGAICAENTAVVNHSFERNIVANASVNMDAHSTSKIDQINIDVSGGIEDPKIAVLWHNRLGHPP